MRPHSFARTRPLKPRMGLGGTRRVLRFAMAWLAREAGAGPASGGVQSPRAFGARRALAGFRGT